MLHSMPRSTSSPGTSASSVSDAGVRGKVSVRYRRPVIGSATPIHCRPFRAVGRICGRQGVRHFGDNYATPKTRFSDVRLLLLANVWRESSGRPLSEGSRRHFPRAIVLLAVVGLKDASAAGRGTEWARNVDYCETIQAVTHAFDAQIGEFSVPKYTCHARADLATRLSRMYILSPKR